MNNDTGAQFGSDLGRSAVIDFAQATCALKLRVKSAAAYASSNPVVNQRL